MSAVMTDGHAEAIGSLGMLADLPQLTAATMTSTGGNWWEYLLLFVAVMASWAGVPMIGSAAAGEAGGLIGYYVGHHWGTRILARPGKRQAGRQKLMDKGERAYAKWGRMAVFFTPAIISGTAK